MGPYLALSGYLTSEEHHIVGKRGSGVGMIQIWKISTDPDVKPHLEICIIHPWGACFDLKWWPMSEHEPADSARIGLLGGCFQDGTFRILCIPRWQVKEHSSEPMFLNVTKPWFTGDLEITNCLKFTWGGRESLAIGCTNGFLALYHVPSIIHGTCLEPIAFFPGHDSFVRDLSFQGGSDPCAPHQLLTSGADGRLLIWDTRDLFTSIPIFRTRGMH
jgi:transcription factor C subunit 6